MLQEVTLFQALFEQRVNHILRGHMQLQAAVIHRFQLLETCANPFRRIGDVLHHMGSEPDFRDPLFLQVAEDIQ